MDRTMSDGIVNELSNHSVDDTVERLEAVLQASGAVLFGLVDHSGEAEKVGLEMKPTKLLIFGNPKAGTPLMLASPSTAIDLPLKMLVWEDAAKKVWISYNSPEYLQKRHGFPEGGNSGEVHPHHLVGKSKEVRQPVPKRLRLAR